MPFPRQFLDELFARTSAVATIGKFVIWDSSKTREAQGDYWACCPFHGEKTPSFHVTESKGTYYCFGCQEKGNVVTFLQKARGMSFREAIELLASEARMQIPEQTPADQEEARLIESMYAALTAANDFFRKTLSSSSGGGARRYLTDRGLTQGILDEFQVGLAPDNHLLLPDLRQSGFKDELLIKCGLAKKSDRDSSVYSTFRNRIIFPIHDRRGRTIAFGGRSMDPGHPAKYLNSPQTPLFNKGSLLFNHHRALKERSSEPPLIVSEGYLDSIALFQAGFRFTVAPLGTAITSEQIGLLWKMAKEPVIALDGDEAGMRAAIRMVENALPLLQPGFSLRFCILPENQDPDDVIRDGGKAAMQEFLNLAMPLHDFLWHGTLLGQDHETPDQKAALRAKFKAKTNRIENPIVRQFYNGHINDRFWNEIIRPSRGQRGGYPKAGNAIKNARDRVQVQQTARYLADTSDYFLEASILALCINNPTIIEQSLADLEHLEFSDCDHHSELLAAILETWPANAEEREAFRTQICAAVGEGNVEKLFGLPQLSIHPEMQENDLENRAAVLLADVIARMKHSQHLQALASEVSQKCESSIQASGSVKHLRMAQMDRGGRSSRRSEADAPDVAGRDMPVTKSDAERLNDIIHGRDNDPEATNPAYSQPGRRIRQRLRDEMVTVARNGISVPKADLDELDLVAGG